MFNNASILITGGTGSFGKQYARALPARYCPQEIIVFFRDDTKQLEMQQGGA